MKNILIITLANLRKGKGQTVNLLIFTLIAALLLNLGLLLMLGFEDFFTKRSEALHAPHYAFVESKWLYTQEQTDYLKAYPGITEVENETALVLFADIIYNGGEMPTSIFFLNVDMPRSMNRLTIIEGDTPEADNDICLPYGFKVGGGYKIGDPFEFDLEGEKITFKVCGFTEEIMFGTSNSGMNQAYLSSAGYDQFSAQIPQWESVILRARLQNPEDRETFFHFNNKLESLAADVMKSSENPEDSLQKDAAYVFSWDWPAEKALRTMLPGITATILVLFAGIIVFVSLLVLRFRIRNTIEENMINIGALKAVGYTGKQLFMATVWQFCLITVVGILAGIGLSYAVLPTVSHVFEVETALQWHQGFDLTCSLISLASILLGVFVMTWLSGRRIFKLQPLTALRQGIVTHSFKRNSLPLDRSRGALSWLMAIKATLQTKGQMTMIFLILAAVSFMATAGLSIYDNLGVHTDTAIKLLAGETPDVTLWGSSSEDNQKIRDFLENNKDTRKMFYYDSHAVTIGDTAQSTLNFVFEDFGILEAPLLYEGRYPKHDNEIVVGGNLAARHHLKIGDTLKASGGYEGGEIAEYLVVGFIQMAVISSDIGGDGGMISAMTIPGMKRIQPDYQPRMIYVYLKDSGKTNDFLNLVNSALENELLGSSKTKELIDIQFSSYGGISGAVAMVLVLVTVLVIFLVLYLMLKTVILRRRREIGIQKALGFTTFQLMNQYALQFMPVIVLGVVAGGLGGVFGFNFLFVALIRGMGIMTATLPAPIGLTGVMCVGLVLLAYAFSMLITWRIRKVSAYALVSE